MNYKLIILILTSIFTAGTLFPAEKWNILIASWGDQSLRPDKNAGLILKKSISSRLSREDNFNVVSGPIAGEPITGYNEAISQGREAKADVIVFGSYFIERDKLYVTAEVYDVLENRLKMRRVYTGAVTIDIFDTADSMASDIVEKIKEALPAMTAENETKVKKIRQTLYETEKINIKRQLYFRFGLMTDAGGKNFNGFSGAWPLTTIDIGFSFPLPGYPARLQHYRIAGYAVLRLDKRRHRFISAGPVYYIFCRFLLPPHGGAKIWPWGSGSCPRTNLWRPISSTTTRHSFTVPERARFLIYT